MGINQDNQEQEKKTNYILMDRKKFSHYLKSRAMDTKKYNLIASRRNIAKARAIIFENKLLIADEKIRLKKPLSFILNTYEEYIKHQRKRGKENNDIIIENKDSEVI